MIDSYLDLEEKLIIVGGGAGGIGSAVCSILEKHGAIIEVADKKNGLDLSNYIEVQNYFNELRLKYPSLYGYVSLVYGGGGGAGFIYTEPEEFQSELTNTLLAAIYPIQKALNWMKECGGGHIVVVSSINSILGLDEASYDIAKGGLNRIAPDIAVAHGKDGIYASTLLPGTVCKTESWTSEKDRADMENLAQWIPDRTITTPEEVAESVAFLLSRHGCMFSGSTICADRGWHLKPQFRLPSTPN